MLVTWQQALDYVFGLANWETRPPGTLPTFELDRMRRLLKSLGSPHQRWPAIHVGGTNGKGATCSYIAAGLSAAGYKVGVYTSPHLHTVRERITIDGCIVGESEFIDWLNVHRAQLDTEPGVTTFEALTAMAFSMFSEADVDVGVIEVGLGGRLDSTNVVRSAATVVTPIGLDHTEVLGETIGAIAQDKCGIVRGGVPLVSGLQIREARDVVEAEAARLGAPLVLLGRDVSWSSPECDRDLLGRVLEVTVRTGRGPRTYTSEIRSLAPYNLQNAALAATVLDVLSQSGWAISADDIAVGLAEAQWPARFECFGGAPTLVVDGAHNQAGAEALLEALSQCFGGSGRHFILGASFGKDVPAFVRRLLREGDTAVTARADHPRAWPADRLADVVKQSGKSARAAASPAAALMMSLGRSNPQDVVVATGSLFLAADVREAWLEHAGLPMPPRDPPIVQRTGSGT